MNSSPISYSLQDDHGKIHINSEITEELALALEQGLEKIFGYYQYERVTLRINSPGGLLTGLQHILEYIDHWRAQGRQVQTEVTFRAASAAALLLALGEVGTRTVHRHTCVLFHHTRIDATSSAITAGGANYLASMLLRTDTGLLMQVANHLVRGVGGFDAFCAQGLSRCEILRTHADAIAHALRIPEGGRHPRWLAAINTMYRENQVKNTTAVYRKYLEKRFDQNTPMDLREGYALNLLDCIHGVPEMGSIQKKNEPKLREQPHLQLAA